MLMHRTDVEVAEPQQDEFDLQTFLRAFTRRWKLIAGITFGSTLLFLLVVLRASPQFAALGTVYLAIGDNSSDQSNFLSDYQVVSSVNAQVQLLQSPALLEQAILETGLNARITPVGASELPYWKWRLKYGKSVGIFAPTPETLTAPFTVFADPAAPGAGFRMVFGKNGQFTMMEPGGWFSKSQLIGTGEWGKPVIVGGAAFLPRAAIGATPPAEGSAYDVTIIPAKVMAGGIAGALSVMATGPAVSPTNIAQVSFVWNNPYQATDFVQHLLEDFIQSQLNWATESASNTQNYISQQLDKIRAALEDASKNQAVYQSQTGIVDVATNAQSEVTQLADYKNQRSTIMLQQEALQQLVKSFSGHSDRINPYLVTASGDPVLASLATTLANAQVKLQADRTQFGEASPEIRHQQATINQIQSAIEQLLSNDASLAAKNLANIDSLIAKYQNDLKSVPGEALKVGQLGRSVDVLGTLYEMLMQKEEEAEVSKAATTEDTRIIAPPELPLFAVSPRPTLSILAGILLGLLASIGIVVLRQAFSRNFRSKAEIRATMPSSIYGIIPRRRRKDLKSGILGGGRNSFNEAFRLLEGKLAGLQTAGKPCVVLVTSAAEADGKSTVAANLAQVLGAGARRILLIDADLECGNLHAALHLPSGPGFAEALRGEPPHIISCTAPFSLLRAGHSAGDSAALLSPQRLRALLAALPESFDFVIIDSPPLPLVSDALFLAQIADLILSVVRVEHTPRRDFAAHCDVLASTKCLYGVVINGVEVTESADYSASGRVQGKRQRRSGTALANLASPRPQIGQ